MCDTINQRIQALFLKVVRKHGDIKFPLVCYNKNGNKLPHPVPVLIKFVEKLFQFAVSYTYSFSVIIMAIQCGVGSLSCIKRCPQIDRTCHANFFLSPFVSIGKS